MDNRKKNNKMIVDYQKHAMKTISYDNTSYYNAKMLSYQ